MEQLKVYWQKTKETFWSLIAKLESSVLFERVVTKYEALPTRNQKTIKAVSTVLAGVLIVWVLVSPLIKTRLNFAENRSFFSLVSSMRLFNAKLEAARKEYVPPTGWQNIQAASLDQLEDSIGTIMASLGLAESQYEVAPQGGTLLVHASEATIKQLESFLFQIDGLFPRFSVIRNKVTRHPQNKELIQFEVEIAAGEVRDSSQAMNEMEDESHFSSPDFEDSEEIPLPPSGEGGLNVPGSEPRGKGNPNAPVDGSVPGFDAPSFTPLEEDGDGFSEPSNPGDRSGGESEFVPPMGDDFIPPPPPSPDDNTFDMMPTTDGDLPPPPAE
jgi:hypothetical protein